MSEPVDSPVKLADLTECTQASVLAEAAAQIAAAAAEKAAAAKARAAEAFAKAHAAQAGEPAADAAKAIPSAAPAPFEATVPVAAKSVAAPPAKVVAERPDRASGTPGNPPARKVTQPAASPQPIQVAAAPPQEKSHRRPASPSLTTPRTAPTDPATIPSGASVAAISREASRAKAHHFRRHHDKKPARPGAAMDPVAHRAGLGAHPRAKRRIVSPGLIFLVALMVFFGMYATGNLPQFDQWTNAAVQSTQAHNAQVVGTIVNGWRMLAYGAAGVCVFVIIFMIVNSLRARHNADGEYDL